MEEKRFAILIDGDNISCDYIKIILDEISTKGLLFSSPRDSGMVQSP